MTQRETMKKLGLLMTFLSLWSLVVTGLSARVLIPLEVAPVAVLVPVLSVQLALGYAGLRLLLVSTEDLQARRLGAIFFAALGGLAGWSSVQLVGRLWSLSSVYAQAGQGRQLLVTFFQSSFMSVLLLCLCASAVAALSPWKSLKGLTVPAAWLAFLGGASLLTSGLVTLLLRSDGFGWKIGIGLQGAAFYGFPGWQLWNVVAVLLSVVLLFGRAAGRWAARGLAVLMAVLPVLALPVVGSMGGVFPPEMIAIQLVGAIGVAALSSSLLWWLGDDLLATGSH